MSGGCQHISLNPTPEPSLSLSLSPTTTMDKKQKKFKIFPDNESIKNEKETRNNTMIVRSSATEATAIVASPTKTSPASTSSATQATTTFPEPMWTIKEFDKTPLLEAKSIKELQVKNKETLFSFMKFGGKKQQKLEEEEERRPQQQQQQQQQLRDQVTIEIVDIEGTLISLDLSLSHILSLSYTLSRSLSRSLIYISFHSLRRNWTFSTQFVCGSTLGPILFVSLRFESQFSHLSL